MRTPYTVMKRTAMSHHAQISILSNEMVRRLGKTDPKRNIITQQHHHHLGDKQGGDETLPPGPSNNKSAHEDICSVIEVFTVELKKSEFSFKEVQQIIGSGVIGWKRSLQRKQKNGGSFYKHAANTLAAICSKKLVEKTMWYRRPQKENQLEDGMDNIRVEEE